MKGDKYVIEQMKNESTPKSPFLCHCEERSDVAIS